MDTVEEKKHSAKEDLWNPKFEWEIPLQTWEILHINWWKICSIDSMVSRGLSEAQYFP